MLREIRIENLVLIELLDLCLDQGLTVLTGETGAGKSIVLQAIALLTGGRAAAAWIRAGAEQAVVEALFDGPESPARRAILSDELGLPLEDEILIKRVLSPDGKSRFYLNGGLATARQVQAVSEFLVSVASQHEHQRLLNPRYHLEVIDLLGGLWPERERVAALFDQWSEVRSELETLRRREMDREQRRDFISYQCREIEAAAPAPGEDEALMRERQRLKGSTDLQRLGQKCQQRLQAAAESLALARKEVEAMNAIDSGLKELAAAVAEQSFLSEEQAGQLRDYLLRLPDDERALEEISGRLTLLQQLKRKYGDSLVEVLAHACRLRQELAELERLDETIARQAARCAALEGELVTAADRLSERRRAVALRFDESIRQELVDLCFAKEAEFKAVFKGHGPDPAIDLARTGWDRCEFMFSANPGEPSRPLAKIASGGELSRVMLALRCLLAQKDAVATVIFDEIDAGIGGKAAEAVARKIRELARHHQVLCITHLPQIAAAGDAHLLVEKGLAAGRTATVIRPLARDPRRAEIARMLDGATASAKSLELAAEMIERHRRQPDAAS